MGIELLSVDWRLDHPDIRREDFFGRTSFSSHDVVFVDPLAISRRWTKDVAPGGDGVRRTDPNHDRGFGRTLSAWMTQRRIEAEDLLKRGGGVLVCRLRTRGEPLELLGDAPADRVDRYDWLPSVSLVDKQHQLSFPSNGRFVPRRGRDVVLPESGSPFEDYLARFRDHVVYDAVYQDMLSTPIDRFATVLARNRVGDPLALEIPFDEGRLVLVPPLEGVSPTEEANALLDAIERSAHRPAFVADPDWLPGYPLPGEEALADELVGLEERHRTLGAKIDEVSAKLREATKPKAMLYTRGRFAFLPAVADAFAALDFEVERDVQRDVLALRSDDGDALVVAAAADGEQVGLPAYRRLLDAVDRTITDGAGHHKGILVVSGSRSLDPKRRSTEFSQAVLRGCQSQGFCLVTAYRLFKLVAEALEDRKADRAELRRRLLECDGEFRVEDAR